MPSAAMDYESESTPLKYFPFQLGECEELENYEPGGFHPVHLGDVYDDQYRVVHKLGFGGFSTVWLARIALSKRWVALKFVTSRESPTYEVRSMIESHPRVAGSRLFAVAERRFWVDGPNGRHLCLVLPVLGPNLSQLSKGIYSRLRQAFAKGMSFQAARALAYLHSNGLCHGDFTTNNMALRLIDGFDLYEEGDLFKLFGPLQTDPVKTYSGNTPRPHAPDYIVASLDFCSSTTKVLSSEICIIDFDQSFIASGAAPERPGIPAKYLAPEVAVGQPLSPASDIWALGCAIFRIRSGDDLFFDYDTDCPVDALVQIVKAMGELPEQWRQTKFDEEGFAIIEKGKEKEEEERGELFCNPEDTRPLEDRVRAIVDEPPDLFINSHVHDETIEGDMGNGGSKVEIFEDPNDLALRVPYSAALGGMVWKPTAVCVQGVYFTAYSEETERMLEAFPRISESEKEVLVDLLSKIFTYDPAVRLTAEELTAHPWFHSDVS